MAYRRRYLSGQSATTVVIAEGAITTDKIVDKAVTQPKVADDAVTSDKIADETIQSEDIKAGEVKTSDLGNGAVTTDKIADQAVTVDKLEASIQGIARPLTPGVSSAEIAAGAVVASKIGAEAVETAKIKDGNVNAAKLAADAVETVKIKDGAVSTAKIAGSAVDSTKIATNAVTGSEILNGSVGVTELATDAVETIKVKDRNITSPKIAIDGVISENVADGTLKDITRRDISGGPIFYDDFEGAVLDNRWVQSGNAGGLVTFLASEVKIATGLGLSDEYRINWGGQRLVKLTDSKPTFVARARVSIDNLITTKMGLWFDPSNYIAFRIIEGVGGVGTWDAVCRSGGAETVQDAGINANLALREFKFVYEADNAVAFYIDGVFRTRITTNIPSTRWTEPYFSQKAMVALVSRLLYVDYVQVLNTRV